MRPPLVPDSNVIIDVLRQRDPVTARLAEAVKNAAIIYLCPFVHFEIMRGFLHRPHAERERLYHGLSQGWHWNDIDRSDWNLGAQLWAD